MVRAIIVFTAGAWLNVTVYTKLVAPSSATVAGVTEIVATGTLILNVKVFATGSVSTPPFVMPPLSCTLKPNAPRARPSLLVAGTKVIFPALISAILIVSLPTKSVVPLSL